MLKTFRIFNCPISFWLTCLYFSRLLYEPLEDQNQLLASHQFDDPKRESVVQSVVAFSIVEDPLYGSRALNQIYIPAIIIKESSWAGPRQVDKCAPRCKPLLVDTYANAGPVPPSRIPFPFPFSTPMCVRAKSASRGKMINKGPLRCGNKEGGTRIGWGFALAEH